MRKSQILAVGLAVLLPNVASYSQSLPQQKFEQEAMSLVNSAEVQSLFDWLNSEECNILLMAALVICGLYCLVTIGIYVLMLNGAISYKNFPLLTTWIFGEKGFLGVHPESLTAAASSEMAAAPVDTIRLNDNTSSDPNSEKREKE